MKTLWIVSEGSPGHVSQSIGLAEALSILMPLQTIIVRGRAKTRGWLRPFIRWAMGTSGRALSENILVRIADIEIPQGALPPDFIISSGGKSVFVAKTFAERYKVPYVFIGERKPYPAKWFHTVISPTPSESCSNSIDVELIPTPVTPVLISEKGTEEKGLWCMILGGASRSRRFDQNDWIEIAQGMNALASREKIRWLISTSRRTGVETEDLLKSHLNPEILEDAIWWGEQPRKELYTFMARSEVLFVTEDSITMVTEAVSSGKPVITIRPRRVVTGPKDFSVAYLERLERNRRIVNIFCPDLSTLELDLKSFSPYFASEAIHTAKLLARRLSLEK